MAGYNRKDWDELDITKEEVESLTQAMKKEEFLKLLAEYAEEITDPENRKQYQEDIIKLEAERGVDCTFVNPEPGFVVKTSVDGKKKAFVNICKNKAVGRPNYKREYKDSSRGLSWSIPMCQAPGREDFDKKKNRCMVYDVVFHPDTLFLAEKNLQFKNLVVETALNAVEDSFKVNLDKKNLKFPKLNFKGIPFATVIRKQSSKPPTLTEEDIEFHNKIKYPFKPPKEEPPVIRNYNKKEAVGKYTTPNYIIKHRSDIDLQEFTYDKTAKINAAIPKELVIEINLPLINSTKTVTLDIMERSLHLLCEKPVKYKLDIQLPYTVNEESGNAKFDKERRLLIISLPVIKAKISFADLMREDSGVESDFSPVGSVCNNEFECVENENPEQKIFSLIKEDEGVPEEEFKVSDEENEKEKGHGTKDEVQSFLDLDKQYLLPGFSCNTDGDNICFVLNVKNVDSNSVAQKLLSEHSCHIKFFSVGSGFFPVYYAFCIDFKNECDIKNVICDTWDNNITVLIDLVKNDEAVTKYYVGLDENSLVEHSLKHPLELKKIMDEIVSPNQDKEENLKLTIKSADVNEVIVSCIPEESNDDVDVDDEDDDDIDNGDDHNDDNYDQGKESFENVGCSIPEKKESLPIVEEKVRTFSESGIDVIMAPDPLLGKSILKKRIQRSLSESCTDDYVMTSSSVEKAISDGSDLSLKSNEEQETPHIKKTVRFNENIRQQLFRVNSSILGRKKKNQKKSRNKKRAMERRLSESENSDNPDAEKDKKANKSKFYKKNNLIKEIPNKENKENNSSTKNAAGDAGNKKFSKSDVVAPKRLSKNDKIYEFKSELIFDLDM